MRRVLTLQRMLATGSLVALAALLLAAGCRAPKTIPSSGAANGVARSTTGAGTVEPANLSAAFMGDASCAECHPKAYEQHKNSRHALTLLDGDRKSLGALAPPTGRIPGTQYEIQAEGDNLFLTLIGKPQFRQALDLAMGSGKQAITFMSYYEGMAYRPTPEDEGLQRVRLSWFPHLKKWYVTPQDERLTDNDPPTTLTAKHARNCLRCHVTTLQDQKIAPEKKFFGVGCEGCHGPGSAHIAAARIKNVSDLKVERMGGWGARKLIAFCDTCHGSEEPVKRTPGKPLSVRIGQLRTSLALMDSLCFQKSGDRLSCLTCHDSHKDTENARTNPQHYEAVCRTCHASVSTTPLHSTAGASPTSPSGDMGDTQKSPVKQLTGTIERVAGKTCPKQPNGRCLTCHMPSRRVFPPGDPRPTLMTDHVIRRLRPPEDVPEKRN